MVHQDDKNFKRFDLTVNGMLTLKEREKAGENYKTVAKALNDLDNKN